MRLLVIVPAYNEQDALGGVLRELRAQARDVLVIDDGSRDRTSDVARDAGARVLRLSRNLGIGGAVQAGLRVAHREGYDAAVQLDGDGQHPPSELPRLLETEGDLVVGTRYRGKHGFQSTWLRRLGSWWIRTLLRVVVRLKVSDPTSGYRVYRRRALQLFDDTYPYDFPEPESLAIARAAGLDVKEVAVTMRDRQGGSSSIKAFDSLYYMIKVTVAVLLTYARAVGRARKEPHGE
ncbi:MAG TPA: glycosyltransferase family 2 protein [Kofleriaceae bacterium]|nr:glycosyltransferase family 2 protein [Kofleriaceae bacterium]